MPLLGSEDVAEGIVAAVLAEVLMIRRLGSLKRLIACLLKIESDSPAACAIELLWQRGINKWLNMATGDP